MIWKPSKEQIELLSRESARVMQRLAEAVARESLALSFCEVPALDLSKDPGEIPSGPRTSLPRPLVDTSLVIRSWDSHGSVDKPAAR